MKIIFLDIDGVLNDFRGGDDRLFLPECVSALNHILEETGAKIVLSSSWRQMVHDGHFSLFGFAFMLRTHGVVRADVVGVTKTEGPGDTRGSQIAEYLSDNPNIGSYVILDDELISWHFPERIVQTDSRYGLRQSDAERAIMAIYHIGRGDGDD